ncbi:MAG: hypothetical protein QW666_02425 [Candidatus Woesearchaeota archaeon]
MKQTIKRIVALGVGLTMVGATIFGASAYTLANWPAPFVVNGVPAANYAITVGDNAAGSDVIGAIDINSALQQAAVVKTTVTAPAVSGVVLTGDAAEVGSTSDLLEINETIGNVRETFTEVDLDMLKGGQIVTDEGSTEYNQYIRFNQTHVVTNNGKQSGSVIFDEDERDKVGHYLYWSDGSQLFEWELEFEEGLESEVTGTGNTRDLTDLEDEDVFILGQPFVIVDTDLGTNNVTLSIDLMGGATGGILGENDKETYVIDGKEYEVEVVVISETAAGGEGSVKFRINGEITDELQDGETDVLADGTQIGIRDILATGKDIQKSIVQFYIGAYKLSFKDDNTSDDSFVSSGTKVNEEVIEESRVQIKGTMLTTTGNEYEITSIKYQLDADAVLGAVFIPPGTGLREQLDEPEGLLTPFWDIRYEGLMDTGVTIVRFDAAGDDKYNLEFTNQEGIMYDMKLLSNEAGVFAFGDDEDDLWFSELDPALGYPIGDDDYFILSDCGIDIHYSNTTTGHHGYTVKTDDNTCFTHVLRFDSIDTANRQLTFTDLGTGTREVTYDANTGFGNLIVGGVTYKVKLDLSTNKTINVDLNGDGTMGNCSDVVIAVQGEGLIAFDGYECMNGTSRAVPVGSCTQNCSSPTNFTFNVVTLQKEFDEAAGDEVINVTISSRSGGEVGIQQIVAGSTYTIFFKNNLYTLEENEDLKQGMSGYGVFFEEYDPHGTDQAEDLTIEYPLSQRGARVFVTGGQVNVQEISTGGVSEQLQPIQLGAAKLASEIANITQFNAIVVGGPCANPLAAQLMGNPEPCWESVPENKAIVKLFTHANGNVALLVAGRTAMNTRQAARAVATGAIKSVAGTEAQISGTSLTDVSVKAV